jgi:VRR-NUC domain/Fanconi anemia-associated nuclease SAP domain
VLPDPFYYLKNFETVLASIGERYAQLLTSEEQRFIDCFWRLPKGSRALLVRMVMRQGEYFRASRLYYPEIGAAPAAAAPLLELGWVTDAPNLEIDQLQRIVTKAELLFYCCVPRPYRGLNKSALVAFLRAQYAAAKPFHEWCKESRDRVYQLLIAALCERFRLMFFGNYRQDWSEFILADLGIFAYEKVPAESRSPAFRGREQIELFEKLNRCRQLLEAGEPPDNVMAGVPSAIDDAGWLEDRRQKLLFQIGRAYEKLGDVDSALAILSSCRYHGARVRTIRLHERAHDWAIARDLCLTAQENPQSEAERQQLLRLLPRLQRKLGGPRVEPTQPADLPTFDMVMEKPMDDCALEYRVRDCLARQSSADTTIHFVENGLIVSLFGLLCWKAIFAPIPGAFFHDFQHGPADLSSGEFYQRRQREFALCLAELGSDEYKSTIRYHFAAKAGMQCPFVAWGLLSDSLLDCALKCFPAQHLRLWFDWIARDNRENRSGFPDLVQFWPQEQRYRMIEVKGPGDRLQDNQRRLLEFCVSQRMPVAVCYVRWRDQCELQLD